MIAALLIALAAALGMLAGFALCHHRYGARLNRLAAYERAARRDVEYRQAVPKDWFDRQINRANAHAIEVAR